MDGLLAAGRAFAAEDSSATSALSAMFTGDVIIPVPGGFAEGRNRAVEALENAPGAGGARVDWAPVRGGISAGGRHGFTST